MAAEELTAVLDRDRQEDVLAYFSGMGEDERRAAAKVCLARYRAARARGATSDALNAALLAVCTHTELRKLGWQARPSAEVTFQVLADRRPPWIEEFVLSELNDQYYWARWPLVRRLVREGISPRPDHPNYVLGMIGGIVPWHGGGETSIHDQLLADPELLDEVWLLFEHEGGGENSLANYDRFGRSGSWSHSLLHLSKSGHLDRQRLLDATLAAIRRDFNHYRAKWFLTFHDLLAPTSQELSASSERYLELLSSATPNVVAFAFKNAEQLDQSQPYEERTLIESLRPVARSRTAGLVKSALKWLDRVAKRSADSAVWATEFAAEALAHDNKEVQTAALERLEKWSASARPQLLARVRELVPSVAASLRSRVQQWIASAEGADTGGPAAMASPEKSKRQTAAKSAPTRGKVTSRGGTSGPEADRRGGRPAVDERQRLQKLDKNLVRLAGLESFAGGSEGPEAFAAAPFNGTDIPRLDESERVACVETLEDLFDVCARAIEDATRVEDFEIALDGISRMCGQRPADFDQHIGPLFKRASARLKRPPRVPFVGSDHVVDLCAVVYAWARGEALEPFEGKMAYGNAYLSPLFPDDGYEVVAIRSTVSGFLARRAMAVARRVAQRTELPVISAPTHRGGLLDARVAAQRASVYVAARQEADSYDVCLAFGRLAPDGRDAALDSIPAGSAEWLQALRYALGAKRVRIGDSAALWTAACRARSPWEDDEQVERRHPGLGPDAGQAAQYTARVQRSDHRYAGRTYTNYRLRVDRSPQPPKTMPADLLTVLIHGSADVESLRANGGLGWRSDGTYRLCTTVFPTTPDALFAEGAQRIGDNLDWHSAEWSNRILLEPLLSPDVPLRPMALVLLTLTLAAKEPGEQGLATDIAIAAIDDGRLDGSRLGGQMAALINSRLIKAARWSKSLEVVAGTSEWHAGTVRAAIEASLRGKAKDAPQDLHALLELLRELCVAAGEPVADETARQYVQALPTSGKTGKIVKDLLALALDESRSREFRAALTARAAAGRIQRLQRWLARTKS